MKFGWKELAGADKGAWYAFLSEYLRSFRDRLSAWMGRSGGQGKTDARQTREGHSSGERTAHRAALVGIGIGMVMIIWALVLFITEDAPPGPPVRSPSVTEDLRNQVTALAAELRAAIETQERLREQVAGLTEQRDWLAARLDALAAASEPQQEPVADQAAEGEPRAPITDAVPEEGEGRSTAQYIVNKGDTLWSIAQRHGVTVTALVEANDIERNAPLWVGQELILPEPSPEPPQESVTSGVDGPPSTVPGQTIQYTVRPGDSLFTISRRFDVTVAELREWNGLRPDQSLQAKQKLTIHARALPESPW